MTHRPRGRLSSRKSWSALLAVLLGALASVSAFCLSTSFAGGLSIAGHSADARAGVKSASLRTDTSDASFDFGGLDDPSATLTASDLDTDSWSSGPSSLLPAAFDLPVSVVRTRDGRTRAPPKA